MKTPSPDPSLPSLSELEALLHDSRTMEDAPSHVLYRAESLWRPAAQADPGPLKRLLASLTFDSGGLGQLALGLRGEGPVRQWLFTCEDHDVDLRAQAMDAGLPAAWRLQGQVLGPEGAGEALLLNGGQGDADEPLRRTGLGEMADFAFDGLAAGAYRVVLLLGPLRVELPAVEVGEPPTGPA